jgi:GWxTD domain-containing protein
MNARWLFGLYVFAAGVANAQRPPGADTIAASAALDSLSIVSQLKDRVQHHSDDSTAWHHLGMVAWTLSVRAQSLNPPPGLDASKLGRLADSSLRMAAAIAPLNVDFRVDVGRYLLGAGVAISRVAARGQFEKALAAARRTGAAPALRARTALAVGRTYWWRYDIFANRRIVTADGGTPRSVSDAMQPLAKSADVLDFLDKAQQAANMIEQDQRGNQAVVHIDPQSMSQQSVDKILAMHGATGSVGQQFNILPQTSFKEARQLLEASTQDLPPEAEGMADFEYAYSLFREAYAADPTYPGAFRAMAMVAADRNRWTDLASLAREQIRIAPHDSLAWLSLGLAAHRLSLDVESRAAFDTALNIMSPAERDRLDNWRRVRSPRSEMPRSEGSEMERSTLERLYWMLANPVWADNAAETKVEFLSRVTYAELRWTVEEFGLSGADTDRGDIHIRYGPPEKIIVIGPSGATGDADVVSFWLYSSGLMFAFRGMPTFGTAHTALGDGGIVESIRQTQPVRWDNVSSVVTDSVPAQVARFRAGVDSVDIVVAALLPAPETIRQSMEVMSPVRRYFWLRHAPTRPQSQRCCHRRLRRCVRLVASRGAGTFHIPRGRVWRNREACRPRGWSGRGGVVRVSASRLWHQRSHGHERC